MLILGIDPSTANFGLALVRFDERGLGLVGAHCVATKPIDGEPKGLGLMRRSSEICLALTGLAIQVDAVAVEAMAFVRGKQRLETAAMSGRARGIVDMYAVARRLSVYEVQAMTAKKALTGKRSASKEDMIVSARRMTLDSEWLTGAKRAHQEHIADAIGVAVAAMDAIRARSKP